ncbi:MAG: tRNA epoxyqueuosine(34) reductase QueG [Alphaproteobacteria bacterium]|nr:tRNA epoxyqueuosine(34) reductase QueG [Alphaproteobacteria bacterium]
MDTPVRNQIRDFALKSGFIAVGFAPATLSSKNKDNMTEFIERGYHGDMGWLSAKADLRASPQALWPDVKSVITLGISYAPTEDPLENLSNPAVGNISVYSRGRDYHEVLKKRLRVVGRWISDNFSCDIKIFVDTAPIMEKPIAQKAGLGWQGKHTNLVSRTHGSWLFLGEIFTTLNLSIIETKEDSLGEYCGSCQRCLDVCPTNAFPAPYKLDARRCISYLTIEHKGLIDRDLRPLIGNRIYGCDDCLAVCPWNKFASAAADPDFDSNEQFNSPNLIQLAKLTDEEFRKLFSKTAIKRIGRERFIRNVLIALGNLKNEKAIPVILSLLIDPEPIVRGSAIWALSRIVNIETFLIHKTMLLPTEDSTDVISEWNNSQRELELQKNNN